MAGAEQLRQVRQFESVVEANVQWSAHAEALGEAKSELEQQMEVLQGEVEAKEQACMLVEERACSAEANHALLVGQLERCRQQCSSAHSALRSQLERNNE